MNKAIFIDRDGVINDDRGHYYIFKLEDFRINEGVKEALKLLQDKGYLLIVISNQGGIARGLYTRQDTDRIHKQFILEMQKDGVIITDILYCPHHQTVEKCLCRKPEPLLIEKALAKYRIDGKSSYFIGDKESDMEAGRRAGINPVKVGPNENLRKILNFIS